jgi:ribosomal protein S27AE
MRMTNSENINVSTPAATGPMKRSSLRYTGCPHCGKALSIAEVIERHCEKCGRQTNPQEMRQIVHPGSSPLTNPDSLTPP